MILLEQCETCEHAELDPTRWHPPCFKEGKPKSSFEKCDQWEKMKYPHKVWRDRFSGGYFYIRG